MYVCMYVDYVCTACIYVCIYVFYLDIVEHRCQKMCWFSVQQCIVELRLLYKICFVYKA